MNCPTQDRSGRSLAIATLLVMMHSASILATDPSSAWNVPGQARTRTCTPMQGATATLHFPDGTPTGFYAYANDPSKNGSAGDCAIGTMEIDAQETLTNGSGLTLYFHPGGGPDLYNDYVNDGQYGHVSITDFTTPPTLAPLNLNGHPCTPAVPGADADFVVNLVGVADDGAIYVGNLTSLSLPPQFVLYRWADESSPQTVVFSGDPGNGNTNLLNQRWGDTLSVRGSGTNTQILIGSAGTLAAVLRPTDASMTAFSATTLTTDVPSGGLEGGLSFGPTNTFWSKGSNGRLSRSSFDLSSGTATTLQSFDAGSFPATISPLSVLAGNNLLAALDIIPGPDRVRLYSVSDPTHAPALLDRKSFATSNSNPSATGALAFGGTNRLYVLDSDNGLAAFAIASVATNPLGPTIFLQPAGQTVLAGSNVVFAAAADGTAPLNFQWQLNNHDIAGATGTTLSLPSPQVGDSGDYTVIVTNLWGSATSSIAGLTVVSTSGPPGMIAYEPFIYNDSSALAGQGGWSLNSGTSGTVGTGNLLVPGLAPSFGNHFGWTSASMSIRLPIGTNTSGSLYLSFAFRLNQLGGGSSDTIAGFTTGTTTTFSPKINVVSNSSGFYNLGVYKGSGLTGGSSATNLFSTNDVVFVVARYVFGTNSGTDDTCDLWLNPASTTFGAGTPPPATIAGIGGGRTDMNQLDRFFFRSAGPVLQCEADEVRIGTNWASVTPPVAVRLGIERLGAAARLWWPTNSSGFTLDQRSALVGASWTTSTNAISVSGTNFHTLVDATNLNRYYRLRR